ncbi:MAG TPA: Type 1 glutamine amidotransferase-like domain-containing protein [Candidatus Saccharimonadia bacterium]|nr:Type 1 glutamine amidotransferase-like domain-containing protein [Candidatus Saccharimonadia bacterium]
MHLFLTSSVHQVADKVAADIGVSVKGMRLAFILTASEVEKGDKQWIEDDRNALNTAGFVTTNYTFTGKTTEQIEKDLSGFAALYMEGGNTFYLLQVMQQTGAFTVVQKLVRAGKLYIGTSAGSIIAGPDIEPTKKLDSMDAAPNLKNFEGLGLVDFVVLPHWGSKDFKELYLNRRLDHAYNSKHKFILLANKYYVEVRDDGWYQIKG